MSIQYEPRYDRGYSMPEMLRTIPVALQPNPSLEHQLIYSAVTDAIHRGLDSVNTYLGLDKLVRQAATSVRTWNDYILETSMYFSDWGSYIFARGGSKNRRSKEDRRREKSRKRREEREARRRKREKGPRGDSNPTQPTREGHRPLLTEY